MKDFAALLMLVSLLAAGLELLVEDESAALGLRAVCGLGMALCILRCVLRWIN